MIPRRLSALDVLLRLLSSKFLIYMSQMMQKKAVSCFVDKTASDLWCICQNTSSIGELLQFQLFARKNLQTDRDFFVQELEWKKRD